MRVFLAALALLATPRVGGADAARAPESQPIVTAAPAAAAPPSSSSRFALALDRLEAAPAPQLAANTPAGHAPIGLGADRARILLRSLTVPGWGQATLGRRTSAKAFFLTEAGVWGSFVSFRVQEALRRRTYVTTARLYAGIDLNGRDEEFRRIVGVYPSSDDYNLFVVRRDAANQFLGHQDPSQDDVAGYWQYIADHELKGKDTWAWDGPESFRKYIEQRKLTRRAALRANAMLGLAIANRLVSAVLAARHAGAPAPATTHSWNLECGPHPSDPEALAVGMRFQF
jgi:hypothetical protein